MADMATCGHIVWDTIRNNKDNLVALHETRAPAWVPETEIRGTFSILLTCLVTLTACVYSAIHLNVPLETGFRHNIARKAGWVVVALVAPELVVMTALTQFLVAWRLSSDLQQLQKDARRDKFVFDLKYAFFIVMGGVRVHTPTLMRFLTLDEMKQLHNRYSPGFRFLEEPDGRPVWQLTPRGILDLARLGHWQYISPQRISDRSKADGLRKSLVLIQVLWMLASCVARKANGLPLTLLEVHTMVHVVCAFVMYAFWFQKPVDIREPEILDYSRGRNDALAYLCQRSCAGSLEFSPRHTEAKAEENTPACECGEVQRVQVKGQKPKVYEAVKDGIQHHRWHAAARAAQDIDPTIKQIESSAYQGTFRPRNGIIDNVNSGMDLESRGRRMSALWLNLCVIPILYGGIHLTAWASEFPSGVERLLWRGSSISIMSTLLFLPWIMAIFEFRENGFRDWLEDVPFFEDHDWLRSGIKWAVILPITLVFWLAASAVLIASVLGRFYLVAEAFVSLRAVPVGVYWVPSWLKYIPHV